YLFFFFFQAEDGIRDRNVTGVQTCALPISASCAVFAFRCLAAASCGSSCSIARTSTRSSAHGRTRREGRRERPTPRRAGPSAWQIGRASCRERVEMVVGAGELKEERVVRRR